MVKKLWQRFLNWVDGVMDPFIDDGYGCGGTERMSEALNRGRETPYTERPQNTETHSEGEVAK
jgi:hypothetical protein